MGSDEYQNRITEFCFRASFHHDPLTPPTTEFVGDIFRSGSGRSVGTMDACRGRVAARRRAFECRVRSAGKATQTEPHVGPSSDARGSGAANADSQTRPQLELRDAGTGSPRERGLSQFLPDWAGKGARFQDSGATGTSGGSGGSPSVA